MTLRRAVGVTPLPPPAYTPPVLPPVDVPHPEVTRRTSRRLERRELMLPGVDDGPRHLYYGEQKIGGKLQFAHWREAQDELWLVIEICAGECDGLISVKFSDGRSVPGVSYFSHWWYPGTAAGTVDTNLAAVLPSWNEALPGTCYAVVRLRKFSTYWKAAVPDLVWRQRCRICLKTDNTWGYSTDGWDQWHDFVRWSEGKKLPASRVDSAAFNAAKVADAGASIKVACHMGIAEDQKPDDVIETFRLMLRAYWFWESSKFRPVADRAGASVATYTDAHISKEVKTDLTRAMLEDRPNKITVWYTDTATGWMLKPYSYPETDPTDDIIEEEFRVPHLHDKGQVKELAIYLYNARVFDVRIKERWQESTSARRLGDIVTRQIESRSLTIPARLIRRTKNRNGTYDVELIEYNAARYATSGITDATKILSTLPDPGATPPAPSGLALTEVGGNLQVSFTAANDWVFYKHTRLTFERTEAGVTKTWVQEVSAGPVVISPLETNAAYLIRAVSISQFDIASTEVTASFGGVTPQEIVDAGSTLTVNSGASPPLLTNATIYWSTSQIRSTTLYGSAFWSNGASLVGLDPAKVNDGDTAATAFTTPAGTSWLKHDTGAGALKRFRRGVVYYTGTLQNTPVWEWSADGTTGWTAFTQAPSAVSKDMGGGVTRLTSEWVDPGSDKQFVRLYFPGPISTTGVVTEVHLATYTAEYPEIREWRVYTGSGASRKLAFVVPKSARPPSAKPLRVRELVGFSSSYEGDFSASLIVEVTTVSAAGVESDGVQIADLQNALAGADGTMLSPEMLQSAGTVVQLSATPADNVGIVLPNGPGPIIFTVGSGTGATLHGIAALVGATAPWINRTGGVLLITHNSATEVTAGNKIENQGAADLSVPDKGKGWIAYDSHSAANRWRVWSVAQDLSSYAPLASPTFTGDPKAPTPATADNDTSVATTAFVRSAMATYGDGMLSLKGITGATTGGIFADSAGTIPPIGMAFTSTSTTSETLVTLLSVTGKGIVDFLAFGSSVVTAGNRNVHLKITVDGVVLAGFNDDTFAVVGATSPAGTGLGRAIVGSITPVKDGATNWLAPHPDAQGIPFKTSILIEYRRTTTTSGSRFAAYHWKEMN